MWYTDIPWYTKKSWGCPKEFVEHDESQVAGYPVRPVAWPQHFAVKLKPTNAGHAIQSLGCRETMGKSTHTSHSKHVVKNSRIKLLIYIYKF